MSARKIIHLDMDAFFCAVEELNNPELKGKAFAVGGRPETRGVVASCSYAARQKGVRSAMPMGKALRLCPELIIVSSGFSRYREHSRKVMAILHELSPLVEQLSIDEAFVDVTDLPEDVESISRTLQQRIISETGLPCSIGAASNKLLAKIANDIGKSRHKKPSPPCSILVVPDGGEEAFLAPLPVSAMWGVGPKTAERMTALGLNTIGDLAAAGEKELVRLFGKNGFDLAQRAKGIDKREIVTEYEVKSQSQETTFVRDVTDEKVLLERIERMSKDVARSLERKGLFATVVRLKIRWANFETHTRQQSLTPAFSDAETIRKTAILLLRSIWKDGRPVRLIGVGVSGLVEPAQQMNIWQAPSEKELKLQELLDQTEKKFGKGVITKGMKKKTQ